MLHLPVFREGDPKENREFQPSPKERERHKQSDRTFSNNTTPRTTPHDDTVMQHIL